MPNLAKTSSLETLMHVSILLNNAKSNEPKQKSYDRKCLT